MGSQRVAAAGAIALGHMDEALCFCISYGVKATGQRDGHRGSRPPAGEARR